MSDDTTDAELNFNRVFAAPRELVFRCMIDPEHLTHFWGPSGVSTPRENIKVEAHPGGAFETVMVNDADGSEYSMRATYVEIVEPERIVWTDPDSGMTTTIDVRRPGRRRHGDPHPPDQRARAHAQSGGASWLLDLA